MRFLLDESADRRLKEHLRTLGHDVTSVVPDYTAGLADQEVLAIAVREQRVLIVTDKDFGELIFRQQLAHAGVILDRLGPADLATKISWLDRLLNQYPNPANQFLVITRRGVRARRAPTTQPS